MHMSSEGVFSLKHTHSYLQPEHTNMTSSSRIQTSSCDVICHFKVNLICNLGFEDLVHLVGLFPKVVSFSLLQLNDVCVKLLSHSSLEPV